VVGVNLPEGVHYIRVAVQTEDLYLSSSDGELAPALDVLGVREVEGAEARLGEVREEDVPSLAKVGLPNLVAGLQVRGREELVGLRVSDCDHFCGANLWCDGNVAREVEMDREWNKFV
jgi:hypothetical protein